MEIYVSVFIFLFGLIVGSFLNVLINRYNTGTSVMGRSYCPVCAKKLSWYELIPIFSFLIQKGKCRGCMSGISYQYPLVEMTTGILFLSVFNLQPSIYSESQLIQLSNIIFGFAIVSVLIVITVYDIRHKIIPNSFVYIFIILSFFKVFGIWDLRFEISNRLDLFAGPLLATPFAFIWFFSKGRLMGLGDGKLALGIGWALGIAKGISSILIAFWFGAIVGIILLFLNRKTITMKSEIPFGPFLTAGFLSAYLFGVDIINALLVF